MAHNKSELTGPGMDGVCPRSRARQLGELSPRPFSILQLTKMPPAKRRSLRRRFKRGSSAVSASTSNRIRLEILAQLEMPIRALADDTVVREAC